MASCPLQYVTSRLIAMAFPDPVEDVAAALAAKHRGHFMIWNISEEGYDYSLFENQVSTPPLKKICG
jgi:hypothetical protein